SDAGHPLGTLHVAANTVVAGGLSFDPASGWRLDGATPGTPLAQPFVPSSAVDPCGIGMSLLSEMLVGNAAASVVGGHAGNDLLQGCVLSVISPDEGVGHFVWRFGALLAADAQAHRLFPDLPVALPAELKAAGG